MLTAVDVVSPRTDVADLTMSSITANSDLIHFRDIQGLGPVKADLASTPFGNTDGDFFTGSHVPKRNIVLTLGMSPDWVTYDIATLRELLYAYFMPKLQVQLKFTSTHMPEVYIDGYVESFEPNMFSPDPEVQVSILCPQPAFVAVDPTVETGVVAADYSSFVVIDNDGTVPTGFVLDITRAASDITGTLRIRNTSLSQEDVAFTTTINSSKKVTLSTEDGSKYIREVNVPAGTTAKNLLTAMVGAMSWLQLKPGPNTFAIKGEPSSGAIGQNWSLTYHARYGGI